MMQVIVAILLIALGMGVDAMYTIIRRTAEKEAYESGYRQAANVAYSKQNAVLEYAESQYSLFPKWSGYQPKHQAADKPKNVVSPEFVERLHSTGRATERIS